MRHMDFTPLYRSTIGFDKLFSMLDTVSAPDGGAPSYPPYNIERLAENSYRISMAVAGFTENELSIEVKENTLTVVGEKVEQETDEKDYLHRGIASRAFERQFQLADYMHVDGASMEHGLLHINLIRELPEAKKPRQIAIKGPDKETETDATVIEGSTH
ncbi:Hsp20 family protein [Cohaesibacter celericrescens]|uniref:Molecular chaperone n=1 Tax=Cohaesibacter celericrescens TaxID=2067669 RepID=A0A2N5XX32_9HYPH|nr:Hsp20 family protein [Cohaesibacter celericrescens]PLW79017.1 molecular chaperone [Cohaesibacter celericrescens]